MGSSLFHASVILNRKRNVSEELNRVLRSDEVLLVHAGTPITKPGGLDQTYDFLPHPDYFWLTGFRRPGGISAYSKNEGWVDFVKPVSRDEKIWEGGGHPCPGEDITGLENWLQSKKFSVVHHMGEHPQSFSVHPELDQSDLLETYNEVRRVKDSAEVELIRKIAGIANEGYKKISTFIRPGVTERDIQLEYESTVLKAGAEKLPYGSIVGAGTNGAILHAHPTSKVVNPGDFILIDAGADIQDYCVDITRMFAADGKMNDRQKKIYDTVMAAQTSSINMMKPGVEWKEVHLASGREIARGLREIGVLNCSVDEALESLAVSVFFPHGVGHMVGLKVRDVGGMYNPNPKKYAGARLRVDLPLKAGYIMTVEPGLYFIEALIKDEETRQKFKTQINWAEAEKWLNFGGVRIEDDILVTAQGPENLTKVVAK